MRLLVSTPLRPLAARMRELASECIGVDVLTGFVSLDAVVDTIGPVVRGGGTVRFLTGTFGHVTRAATFRHLYELAKAPNASVRIWDCGTHRNLHAKLFAWHREDGGATVWIGSANLTDGGLQNEGELVAELTFVPGEEGIGAVSKAFQREWRRGQPLDEQFLKSYREAPHGVTQLRVFRRRHGRKAPPTSPAQRMFVATASATLSEDGAVVNRVDELLGGTAERWYRHRSRVLDEIRSGDWCLYIDIEDGDVAVVIVTDVVRDGDHVVFAYEAFFDDEEAWRPFTKRLRAELGGLGLRRSAKSIAGQWVPPDKVLAVCQLLYPSAGWGASAPAAPRGGQSDSEPIDSAEE